MLKGKRRLNMVQMIFNMKRYTLINFNMKIKEGLKTLYKI